MALKINGTIVVDDGRNITGVAVTGSSYLSVGYGSLADRPSVAATGQIRYNTSSGKIEVYNGSQWRTLDQTYTSSTTGLFSFRNSGNIDYIVISTTGNAQYFGDVNIARIFAGTCADNSVGLTAGGGLGPATTYILSHIEKNTVSSKGNANLFGDLTLARYGLGGCNSDTRGVFGGGYLASVNRNTIDYVTISTEGNATDFGDLTVARYGIAGCSSPTRGIFAGLAGYGNTIDYITIASTGNATDFGDLNTARDDFAACSTPTRAVFAGGRTQNPSYSWQSTSVIDYTSISSTGSTSNFGNLSVSRGYLGACSSPIRGVFGGGASYSGPVYTLRNTIDYVTISTIGNATTFGTLTSAQDLVSSLSNSNGGLGLSSGVSPTTLSGEVGVFGSSATDGTMNYINISSTGNALYYGTLANNRAQSGACGSSTKGFFGGGYNIPATSFINSSIETFSFSSTGESNGFGDLTIARYGVGGCNSTTRGVFGGGYLAPANRNTIDYITMASEGNATDFGDLTVARYGIAGCSSPTRGIFAGLAGYGNTIDYITIASTGNAIDFGDLVTARDDFAACSSPTRGVFAGGRVYNASYAWQSTATIDYIGLASAGSSTTFGNLTLSRGYLGACSSPTRGVFGGGGYYSGPSYSARNEIDYIGFESLGNATDFGDLTVTRDNVRAASNSNGGLGISSGVTPTPLTGEIGVFGANDGRLDYITISSTGNATSLGGLMQIGRSSGGSCASSTRGIFGGGYGVASVSLSSIEYLNLDSTGESDSFGDLTLARYGLGGCNSDTRGVFGGGYLAPAVRSTIDYITMASEGNAVSFGLLSVARYGISGCSSPTRGIFAGQAGYGNMIDYITIASAGNALDFGDLSFGRDDFAACSSSTRGVFGGGRVYNASYAWQSTAGIDYITIASTGNATTFGNLTLSRGYLGACSSPTRGVFGGGGYLSGPSYSNRNEMDYITIASTGNATDFGDLTTQRVWVMGVSNSNGGL